MLQALREAKKESETKVVEHKEVKKEVKKETKEVDKKETTEELRKKQEEFLETGENEIVSDDVELEETTPVKKTKRGRKKKES